MEETIARRKIKADKRKEDARQEEEEKKINIKKKKEYQMNIET